MSFLRGLLTARSHLAFLLGLALAVGIVVETQHYLEAHAPKVVQVEETVAPAEGVPLARDPETVALAPTGAHPKVPVTPWNAAPASPPTAKVIAVPAAARSHALADALRMPSPPPPLRPTGVRLSADEQKWAKAAWAYFEHNYQPTTGLVNSNDNYPSTTLWDLGSYVMALHSAEALGILKPQEAQARLEKLLATLVKLPLVEGKLPNKAYHTRTLEMVDYNNNPVKDGLGWSAIDLARLGVPLQVTLWRHPELTAKVQAVFTAWRLELAVSGGALQGAQRKDGALNLTQEARLGYEQYAAKSFLLLGMDVSAAMDTRRHLAVALVSGQPVAYDDRMPKNYDGTHNAVLSEPYVLEGLEFGFDQDTLAMARALLLAQQNRAKEVGKPVAVSEDNLDKAPYFVYNSVLNGGHPWAAFTPDGQDASAYRSLSTKAALGWAYLFEGAYPDALREAAAGTMDPARGWYSGRYDSDGSVNKALTANTNGIVLEVLAYRVQGPWLRAARTARTAKPVSAAKGAP